MFLGLANLAQAAQFPVITPTQLKALYAQKVSPFLVKELAAKGLATNSSTEAMILMDEQANFEENDKSLGSSRTQRLATIYKKLVDLANSTQRPVAKFLDQKGVSYQRFFISNTILVQNVTPELLNELIQFRSVSKILANPKFTVKLPQVLDHQKSFSTSGVGDNLTALGVDKIWKSGNQGQNIVIAGQDTGVQWDHPALKNAYRGNTAKGIDHNYNWHDSIHKAFNSKITSGAETNKCGYELTAPCDDDQHGSHTMGTMIGSDGAENQIGMAPKAKWIACRNMDAGAGKPSTYLECFQFFLAPTPLKGNAFTDGKPELAPNVINNSWGCPPEEGCSGDEFLPALKALKAAGVMVVVSAGNDGPGCSTIKDGPAYHSGFGLVVGAHDHRNGKLAYFSSRGPSTFDGGVGPDITAPGVSIRSSIPGNGYEGGMWSGTSMAGPHVAGMVALMWSAHPNLIGKIKETVDIIHRTAEKVSDSQSCGGVSGSAVPNNSYGYGRIRPVEAVKAQF